MDKRGAKIRQINTYTRAMVRQHHIVLSEKNTDSTNELLHMHSGATALHRNDGTDKSWQPNSKGTVVQRSRNRQYMHLQRQR